MGFPHFWCWRAARHLLLWLARRKSIFPFPWGNSTTLLNGTKATLALSELFVAFTSTMSHSFPVLSLLSHGLPSLGSQSMPAYSSLEVPDMLPAQSRAAVPFIFHVHRRAQFHLCCAAALLIPSVLSPLLSLTSSWVSSCCSAGLHPSVARGQAFM